MNTLELLQQIFQVCIIPLLGVLTSYIVMYVRKKTDELKQTTDNEMYHKYLEMLKETVVDCVLATNQTYVEALKKKNAFDKEAQKEAFALTYNAVVSILAEDAQEYLDNVFDDLGGFIEKLIEAEVNKNKSVIIIEQPIDEGGINNG